MSDWEPTTRTQGRGLSGSERDPLDQMGIGRVIQARLHRVDLSAGFPSVPVRPLTPLFTATRLRPRVL